MSKFSLFIADVHLQTDPQCSINTAFRNFLKNKAHMADNLYILGDLFNTWIGDDIDLNTYAVEINAIRELVNNGTTVWIMFGNRDFLMRKQFWKATGARFLSQPKLLNLYEQTFIILHGDSLCTDDKKYQQAKLLLNNPIMTWLFLRLPFRYRNKIAKKMRQKSNEHTNNKPIMDVAYKSVSNLFLKYTKVDHMIHGHTHKAKCHTYNINNCTKYRWVLGDWRPNMYYMQIEPFKKPVLIYL